jgi:hypothetical protein
MGYRGLVVEQNRARELRAQAWTLLEIATELEPRPRAKVARRREQAEIDESKFRFRLYLHEGLDLEATNQFWSSATRIPLSQFGKPYRGRA